MKRLSIGLFLALLFAVPAQAANRLDVSEYNGIVITTGLIAQVAPEPGLDQIVDFSGGVAQSAAFGTNTTYIWIMCDTQCSFLVGSNPTATTSNKRLPALTPVFVGVRAGQKISVIASP